MAQFENRYIEVWPNLSIETGFTMKTREYIKHHTKLKYGYKWEHETKYQRLWYGYSETDWF